MADQTPRRNRAVQVLSDPFQRFIELETGGAILLLIMTIVAVTWANSPWGASYDHFWHTPVTIGFGHDPFTLSLAHWVNDGLMAIFFFVVGMEIKREVVLGELSSIQRAMLPLIAAVGGMVVPALIYASFHQGGPAASGWGVPMATDIAFAVAALAALGSRVPASLKIFLLALAIADDLGAVLVIAVFYTEQINTQSLMLCFAALGLVLIMNIAGVRAFLAYWLVGALAWFLMYESGVHATIAGVLLGLLTPASADTGERETLVDAAKGHFSNLADTFRSDQQADYGGHKKAHIFGQLQGAYIGSQSPLDYLTNLLEKWVAFFIMPLFALANAGVIFDSSVFGDPTSRMVGVAVAAGLLLGKPLGIGLFSFVAVKLKIAAMPTGTNWGALLGVGLLAGIGFTMSLFVTNLAFSDPMLIAGSKIGIFGGSLIAAILGIALLKRYLPEAE
ncbi:MAG: Na+/H+ antiporter NhaA [Deltaproteobacteria bacterium]